MKWLAAACMGALAVAACQNIHSAPIDDDDARPDAASDVAIDAPVEASACKTDVAPATCGHDETIPLRDAGTDADTDADADVLADIDAAPPSELPPAPACTVAKHQLTCDRAGGGGILCTSDSDTCTGADPGACRDECCADEYGVACSGGIAPAGCRMLAPLPGGMLQRFCCACR